MVSWDNLGCNGIRRGLNIIGGGGAVNLLIYPTGDRTDEPIKLKILGSTHQQNSDKLIIEDPAKQQVMSSVEEVSDEGF